MIILQCENNPQKYKNIQKVNKNSTSILSLHLGFFSSTIILHFFQISSLKIILNFNNSEKNEILN